MSTPAAETTTFVELLKQISSVQSPEQLLDTCENLEKFLEARRGKNIAHLFSVDLALETVRRGFSHSNDRPRELTYSLVELLSETPEGRELLKEKLLIQSALQGLQDPNVRVAVIAQRIALNFSVTVEHVEHLLALLSDISKTANDEHQLRLWETMVKVSCKSEDYFRPCLSHEHFQQLFTTLPPESEADLSFALNCIELVQQLSECPWHVSYLEESGFVKRLSDYLSSGGSNASVLILVPEIRLFATLLSQGHAAWISKYRFNEILLSFLHHDDELVQESAVGAIGTLGKTTHGICMLLDSPLREAYYSLIETADSSLRIAVVCALSELLSTLHDDPSTEAKLEEFFTGINTGRPVAYLYSCLETPISDLRFKAFAAMQELAKHSWGARSILEQPGMFEYLMNRTTETTNEGRKWKYAIVQHLDNFYDICRAIVQTEGCARIKYYLKSGVNYVPSSTAAIVQDESSGL